MSFGEAHDKQYSSPLALAVNGLAAKLAGAQHALVHAPAAGLAGTLLAWRRRHGCSPVRRA